MSPITHFLGSWLVATVAADNPRDRRLVTLAGVIPDLDGLGMVADMVKNLTSGQEPTFLYYQRYHHVLLHGWPGAILVALLFAGFARRRTRVALGCLVTFHLHLLCDLLGSRGPSVGDLWPICYSEPIFSHPVWFWRHQWQLDGWQNQAVFLVVFVLALWQATKRGHSFMEVFSERLDGIVVGVLRGLRGRLSARPNPAGSAKAPAKDDAF